MRRTASRPTQANTVASVGHCPENTLMMTQNLPALPTGPSSLVNTQAAFDSLCAELRAAGSFGFDTEFIGETSFHPILCLIQVTTATHVALIDPFAITNMQPLWDLIADAGIVKICHAGAQDVAIAAQQGGKNPLNIMDTQVLAGMIGLGYPLSYAKLVELYAEVKLDKAHTYSAWNRRPLKAEQFDYAVDDVRYLLLIYQKLSGQLASLNRTAWGQAACEEICHDLLKPPDPREVYKKIKFPKSFKPLNIAILRELAAWREQAAFEHNMPPRTFMADEVLRDIARNPPAKLATLGRIENFPATELNTYGPFILELVRTLRETPESELPAPPPNNEQSPRHRLLIDTLWAGAQMICLGQSISTAVVTSQAEIAALADLLLENGDLTNHPLMQGWRAECLGKPLLDFINGRRVLDAACKQQMLSVVLKPTR